MKHHMKRLFLYLILIGTIFSSTISISTASSSLPDAQEIVARYLEAIGGVKACQVVENSKARALLQTTGGRYYVTIIADIFDDNSGKHYSLAKAYAGVQVAPFDQEQDANTPADIIAQVTPALQVEEGTDGTVVWELTDSTSANIKDGEERASRLRRYNPLRVLMNWQYSFKNIQTAGVEDVKGKTCYKVLLTPLEGTDVIWFFRKDTGLLEKTVEEIQPTAGEKIETETYFSDYSKIGDILIARKSTVFENGQKKYDIVLDSIEFNVAMPANVFDLPLKVKELIEKKKAQAARAHNYAQKGPFGVSRWNGDGIVFYPTIMEKETRKWPVIAFANDASGDSPTPFLQALSSWGFIVVGSRQPRRQDGLPSILRMAKEKGSLFYEKVETDEIGLAGLSDGGAATMIAAQGNNQIKASVLIATTPVPTDKIKTALLFLAGGRDTINPPDFIHNISYSEAAGLAFFAVHKESAHGTFYPDGGPFLEPTIAFFRWKLLNDKTAGRWFEGQDCILCQDKEWNYEKKQERLITNKNKKKSNK